MHTLAISIREFDVASLYGEALRGLDEWAARARQRHHLSALDDRLLKDIGLSRADAERESRKPFWRA